MRTTTLLGLPILLLVLPSTASADEPSKPWVPMKDTTNIRYSGTVTDVTKVSISILWPGEEKPKTFFVSETLAAGGIPKEPRSNPKVLRPYTVFEPYRYRLTDVRIGDQVVIVYAHLGEADICDHICINKRPGGRVPPLPEGAVAEKKYDPRPDGKISLSQIPYHERMNAYWDLEERGIPYPEKFGQYRQWPVAPMPREVTPKP